MPKTQKLYSEEDRWSRRILIHYLSFMGGGVVLLGNGCKPQNEAAKVSRFEVLTTTHRTFTDDEYSILSAATDRILPRDQDPGALDANVPEYIDRMLQTPLLEKMREDFVSGLAALDRRCRRMHQVQFSKATVEQQDATIAAFKNSEEHTGESKWYEILVVLTLEGFLGDPSYGGNKDQVGWKLVGFDLVGRQAASPGPGYDGLKHLHTATCGGGKGC